ncbi:protein GLUTAMINE DUMPER 3-like [Dendrobium catenatum]|uniref:Protein GLUTAMINE DUMPER 2 n=1 Tax=Dendrobium catenatum TaxID=906689 RepID=A0A2I0VA52_9ASPA|nr:protein GLUTAMINE DUMPER 3-like [Dendrobium catenatum]PKU60282.1 Protein GLUTAMINE DUMPER 2 [Dendrobium catenatum]
MRPGATFSQENAAKSPAASATVATHSAWHSPVPYLFGGLAAMLGLIAFALLILACSYWKLSGYLEGDGDGSAPAAGEDAEKSGEGDGKLTAAVYEERIVVIMAGEKKPTFLATPMSSRASSFGDRNGDGDGDGEGNGNGDSKLENRGNERTANGTTDEDQRTERQERQPE